VQPLFKVMLKMPSAKADSVSICGPIPIPGMYSLTVT
jgi:hypothetical protein